MQSHVWAIVICAIAVAAEGSLMGRDGYLFMRSLQKPSWSVPIWAWSVIGLGYYMICYYVIYRLREYTPATHFALVLVAIVMGANSFWNYLYFRRRDLKSVFFYSVCYAVVAWILFFVLLIADRLAALAFGIYAVYLPYALALFYRTWRLNTNGARIR
jgi:tryptophan-rich sensory protein